MEYATGIILLAVFLVVVALIVRGQSPIIMLLLLAIAWAAIAGIGIQDIQKEVISGGGVKYASSVIQIVFGAWFAQVLIQTGIAESVIRSAAELAGDRPVITAMVLNLVTALLFTGMFGVGAAIALGVVAIPIMLNQGIPTRVAAPAFTMGVGAGLFVNPTLFGQFKPFFPGIVYEMPWQQVWMTGLALYVFCAWLMIYLNLRVFGVRKLSSVDTAAMGQVPRKRTPYYTYIVPLVPVVMVMIFKWEIIAALLVSIVCALLLTARDRTFQGHLNLFNKTFYDAFPDIATIAALWTICGMIIVTGQMDSVKAALKPIFAPILPHTKLEAAVFFGALGGILSIYRGPLVVVGTGAAVLAILLANNDIAVPYLYSLWLGATVLQGSMDPTNSWTMWTISYTKVPQVSFLKTALPFGCLMVAIYSAVCYFLLSGVS